MNVYSKFDYHGVYSFFLLDFQNYKSIIRCHIFNKLDDIDNSNCI